jgi:hypothetical protein
VEANDNTLAIILAALLAVSEALALIPQIKSNSIFQLIVALIRKVMGRPLVLALVVGFAMIHPFNGLKVLKARVAWAADCDFKWTGVSNATGYDIEYSADGGTTWTGRKTTGALVMDAAGEVRWTYTGVPETGLIIFRVSALGSGGARATRVECGAWYNHLWKPLGTPSGSGIVGR